MFKTNTETAHTQVFIIETIAYFSNISHTHTYTHIHTHTYVTGFVKIDPNHTGTSTEIHFIAEH